MAGLFTADDNTRVTAANIGTYTDDVVDADPWVEVLEDLTQRSEFEGGSAATAATADDKTQLAFKAGQVVRESELLNMMTDAEIDSITPATGAAAGGTAVVIKGSGFDGATGVTFGGTAGTSFSVVDPTEIHVTTPAKTAGTYNVVVSDDAGAVTKVGGFVYT